jgi:hypothetical protein
VQARVTQKKIIDLTRVRQEKRRNCQNAHLSTSVVFISEKKPSINKTKRKKVAKIILDHLCK